jgi:hypothetical protein
MRGTPAGRIGGSFRSGPIRGRLAAQLHAPVQRRAPSGACHDTRGKRHAHPYSYGGTARMCSQGGFRGPAPLNRNARPIENFRSQSALGSSRATCRRNLTFVPYTGHAHVISSMSWNLMTPNQSLFSSRMICSVAAATSRTCSIVVASVISACTWASTPAILR